MDSVTLLHYVKKRLGVDSVYALSCAYGQKHSRELEMARRQAAAVGVVEHREADLSFISCLIDESSALTSRAIPVPDMVDLDGSEREQPCTYVPHRNLTLLSAAAAYAEGRGVRDVFYGAQAQDEYAYWDCTGDFVERLNGVLALNRRGAVTVHAPFVGMRKAKVLEIGIELGVDYAASWTCYRGGERPCGKCPSCVERETAFAEVGVDDPLVG